MIIEALKYIAELGAATMKPVPVGTDDPTRLTFLIDGDATIVDKPVPPRKHISSDLDTLINLIQRFGEQTPSVWVSEENVVLVIDDMEGHRVNRVTHPLHRTEVFAKLEELANAKPWLEQKAFLRLLRIDLAGTLPPGILLDRVKKLRFESGQVTTQEANRNRESLGRQITAAASGDGEIPEAVTLEVAVYRGGPKYAVACSVDIDAARGLLQIAPLPDEIERAVQLALDDIQAKITESVGDDIANVYQGQP